VTEPMHRLYHRTTVVNIGLRFGLTCRTRCQLCMSIGVRPRMAMFTWRAAVAPRRAPRADRAGQCQPTRLTGRSRLVDCRPAREAFGLPMWFCTLVHPSSGRRCVNRCRRRCFAPSDTRRAVDDDAAARWSSARVHLAPCHHWELA
jgi:hypothetical protein